MTIDSEPPRHDYCKAMAICCLRSIPIPKWVANRLPLNKNEFGNSYQPGRLRLNKRNRTNWRDVIAQQVLQIQVASPERRRKPFKPTAPILASCQKIEISISF